VNAAIEHIMSAAPRVFSCKVAMANRIHGAQEKGSIVVQLKRKGPRTAEAYLNT
jgi:hypothetical protein